LLLLDEPFSSLDRRLKQSLIPQVKAILQAEGTTAVIVTHDEQEALLLANKIGYMENGKILEWKHVETL
jgi:iron(III) transport system ATP-binding protein